MNAATDDTNDATKGERARNQQRRRLPEQRQRRNRKVAGADEAGRLS